MTYTFHWRQAFAALPVMLGGTAVTLEITILSMLLGTCIAVALAIALTSGHRWPKGVAIAWVEIARNTPALFQIYMAYFGLGSIGIRIDSFAALLAGITFNNAGYLAETFRSGLEAVPRTQAQAARSLGLSVAQAYRWVVLPQTFRIVFFPLTNQMVWAILMTSLGVVVGLNDDLAGVTQDLNVRSFRTLEFFALSALLYFAAAKTVTLSARLLAWRLFRY